MFNQLELTLQRIVSDGGQAGMPIALCHYGLIFLGCFLVVLIPVWHWNINLRKKRDMQVENLRLRQSEERLALAIQGTKAGLWDWCVQTGQTVYNERWADMIGFTIEELEPVSIDTWIKRCHPDDLEASNRALEKHFSGESSQYEREVRMRHKNGDWIWVLDRGKVVERDKTGAPVRVAGTHIDITGKKQNDLLIQAERDLAAAWSCAGSFHERLSVGLNAVIRIAAMDCGGLYLVNEADSSLELVVHQGLSEAFIADSRRYPADSDNARMVREGIPIYAQYRDLAPPKTDVMAKEGLKAIAVIPVCFQNRAVACLNLASHTSDRVSEHTHTALETIAVYMGSFIFQEMLEEKNRQNRQDLEMLFNTIEDMLLILDIQGNIVAHNEILGKLLGYAPGELIGRHVLSLHPPNRREEAKATLERMMAKKTEFCHIPVIGKSGQLIPVETKVMFGHWKDREAIFGISRDVSKRLQMERQTQQIEKAQSLGRMAGAIAHHFNNMLSVVVGNIEMVMEDLPPETKITGNLSDALEAAQRAVEMSHFMLTYMGQSKRTLKVMDLCKICDRAIPKLREMMPGNIRLLTGNLSPGPVVQADAGQIGQMLIQLVNNAKEAIGAENGEIRLSVRTLPATQIAGTAIWPPDWNPDRAEYAMLQVADTGCGIRAADIDKVMDPFFSTKFTGRGMGLAMVLGIVRAHKGALTVQSNVGLGSIFQVFFPIVNQALRPRLEQDAGLPAAIEAKGPILLVEDEDMVLKTTRAMLERIGFEVLIAKNGMEALEIFREKRVEIEMVLTDLSMPRMNGWATLSAIRNLRPDIPVILASGYSEAQIMAEEHPPISSLVFLKKPYHIEGLRNVITKALAPAF
jgi:PAS domain S-box-containing protein